MKRRPTEDRNIAVPWGRIYGTWELVVCDLQQVYGITWHLVLDWPWPVLRGYVEGLFTVPTSRTFTKHIEPLTRR